MSPQPNYSFLEDYILKVLEQSGLGELTEENRNKFLPQLVAKAEYNIGIALMPKLSEEDAGKFATMMEDQSITSEAWQDFWKKAIPDFDKIVQEVLIDFGKQCKTLLGN